MNGVIKIGTLIIVVFILSFMALFIIGFQTPYIVEDQASESVVLVNADESTGTGVIINENQVLTSCHVITSSDEIIVQYEQEQHRAEVIGKDQKTDLAVLEVNNNFEIKIPEVAEKTRSGDTLYSYPYNGNEISSIAVDASDYIEINKKESDLTYFKGITGEVVPGYSGGPTFNSEGELSGIQFMSVYNENNEEHEMSVIVSAQALRDVVPDLQEHGQYTSGDRELQADIHIEC